MAQCWKHKQPAYETSSVTKASTTSPFKFRMPKVRDSCCELQLLGLSHCKYEQIRHTLLFTLPFSKQHILPLVNSATKLQFPI